MLQNKTQFLMHRVELKAYLVLALLLGYPPFLMHRVELKVLFCLVCCIALHLVPNAPCGVESVVLSSALHVASFLSS